MSSDNFVINAYSMVDATDIRPPDFAIAPPKPIAPAPMIELVKLYVAEAIDEVP